MMSNGVVLRPRDLGNTMECPRDLSHAPIGDELAGLANAFGPARSVFLDTITSSTREVLVFKVRLDDRASGHVILVRKRSAQG